MVILAKKNCLWTMPSCKVMIVIVSKRSFLILSLKHIHTHCAVLPPFLGGGGQFGITLNFRKSRFAPLTFFLEKFLYTLTHTHTLTFMYNNSRMLQIQGDLEDLETAFGATRFDLGSRAKVVGSGSCSALVKLLPGYKELYVSHDTWGDYNQMLRIFKLYDLSFDIGGGFRESIMFLHTDMCVVSECLKIWANNIVKYEVGC